MAHKRLGRGLDALIGAPGAAQEMAELALEELHPGKHQPRRSMDQKGLQDLAASMKEAGVLQPVVARRDQKGGYELVMGERRWRAASLAGLKTIPAVVREVDDREALVMALVENLQREDLNPVEKARAFKSLLETLGLTQAQAAGRLGVSRVALTNTLRLLELPAKVKEMLSAGRITAGHARALLSAGTPARMVSLAGRVVAEGLSVRQVEELASGRTRGKKAGRRAGAAKAPEILAVEAELSELLGTRVRVERGARGGKLVLEFYGADDFEVILSVLRAGAKGARAGG
jgi:ParB family chromosome partitioning protein